MPDCMSAAAVSSAGVPSATRGGQRSGLHEETALVWRGNMPNNPPHGLMDT